MSSSSGALALSPFLVGGAFWMTEGADADDEESEEEEATSEEEEAVEGGLAGKGGWADELLVDKAKCKPCFPQG